MSAARTSPARPCTPTTSPPTKARRASPCWTARTSGVASMTRPFPLCNMTMPVAGGSAGVFVPVVILSFMSRPLAEFVELVAEHPEQHVVAVRPVREAVGAQPAFLLEAEPQEHAMARDVVREHAGDDLAEVEALEGVLDQEAPCLEGVAAAPELLAADHQPGVRGPVDPVHVVERHVAHVKLRGRVDDGQGQ